MQIVLQRKLGIKPANIIVHIYKKKRDEDTESGTAQTARLVVNKPNPRTQSGSNALSNPKIRLMQGESNEAPEIVESRSRGGNDVAKVKMVIQRNAGSWKS